MDRRTLLAFVLLTLVLVLFQWLAPKAPPRGVPGAAPAPAEPSARTPAPGTSEGSSSGESPAGSKTLPGTIENTLVPPDSVEHPISVNGGVYQAVLNPVGGELSNWTLTQYTDAQDQPVDLVPDSGSGMFTWKLLLPQGTVDLARTRFQVARNTEAGEEHDVLTARSPSGAVVRIAYLFPRDRYSTQVDVHVEGVSGEGGGGTLELSFAGGITYPEREARVDNISAAGVALLGSRYVKHTLGRNSGGWEEDESGVVHWAGVRSKYFLMAAVPASAPDGEVRLRRLPDSRTLQSSIRLPLNLAGPTDFKFTIYAGPMSYMTLESYGVGLEKAVDLGWRVLSPFTRLLLRFFRYVHTFIPNYGVVIIVLSVLSKLVFYPLTKKSVESMKQMQVLKPEIDRMNAKYKDDPQRRNQAMMELYKKNKVNPMGGCLPILIQMPVFFALYAVLNSSIELRKAPFIMWIRDLSSPDRVGSVAGFPIHVLPLVMAGTMIWQQKLTPTDPRQASLAYLMPIIMTFIFYPMPSGLVLYWTVNNIMTVGQQIWMNRNTVHQQLAA